jgi:hypothetical protein
MKIYFKITDKEVTVKLEQIRKTPRKRPDWASMMKEIESGKKLKRVQTNDRSQPILPKSKAKGKVVHGQTLPITTCSDDTGIDGDMNTKEVVKRLPSFSSSLVSIF